MNTQERINNAAIALQVYVVQRGEVFELSEEEVQDLICDLYHLAEQEGFDIASIKRCADINYQAESKGD